MQENLFESSSVLPMVMVNILCAHSTLGSAITASLCEQPWVNE